MYCTSCGKQVPDGARFCLNCGKEMNAPSYGNSSNQTFQMSSPPPTNNSQHQFGNAPNVENHLVKAVLSTLFCCLPLGIVAIVYASQVNTKVTAGDYQGAQIASDNASRWGNISIGIGLVVIVVYVLLVVLSVAAGVPIE